MGIFSKEKKKTGGRGKEPFPESRLVIEFFPLHLLVREGNMISALLEALQEISGLVMTSRPVERVVGAFFVIGSLISGVALLVTMMYLISPDGFQKRLNKALVEKPVVEALAEKSKE
ncbi:MAG TPA: hypothetical protein ACFYD5_04435 [Candidatus Tripitaka sp. YC43]